MTMENEDLENTLENEGDEEIYKRGDWSRFAQVESNSRRQTERVERELANATGLEIKYGGLCGKVRDPVAKEMKKTMNDGIYGGYVVTRKQMEQQGMHMLGPKGYGKLNHQERGSRVITETF